ncbi:uncharacterized protein LOC142467835 [Ascaphus truei]|uniref:uncharacterized protein LOC142467835 n=1 Tax=Ascaphus truei TaxID=8439 RepID=UPI003F59AB06
MGNSSSKYMTKNINDRGYLSCFSRCRDRTDFENKALEYKHEPQPVPHGSGEGEQNVSPCTVPTSVAAILTPNSDCAGGDCLSEQHRSCEGEADGTSVPVPGVDSPPTFSSQVSSEILSNKESSNQNKPDYTLCHNTEDEEQPFCNKDTMNRKRDADTRGPYLYDPLNETDGPKDLNQLYYQPSNEEQMEVGSYEGELPTTSSITSTMTGDSIFLSPKNSGVRLTKQAYELLSAKVFQNCHLLVAWYGNASSEAEEPMTRLDSGFVDLNKRGELQTS